MNDIERRETLMETEYGQFRTVVFQFGNVELVALLSGKEGDCPLLRIQSACLFSTAFRSTMCDCGQQIESALRILVREPYGILIYHPHQEARGHGLLGKMEVMAGINKGLDIQAAQVAAGRNHDLRTYEHVPTVLRALAVGRVEVLGRRDAKVAAIETGGITVTGIRELRI